MTWKPNLVWQLRKELWHIPGKDNDPSSFTTVVSAHFSQGRQTTSAQTKVISLYLVIDHIASFTGSRLLSTSLSCWIPFLMFFQHKLTDLICYFPLECNAVFLIHYLECPVKITNRLTKLKTTQVFYVRANSLSCGAFVLSLWQVVIFIKLTLSWWLHEGEKITRAWGVAMAKAAMEIVSWPSVKLHD